MLTKIPERFNVLVDDRRNRRSDLTVNLDEACQPMQGIEVSRLHSLEGAPERIRNSVSVLAETVTWYATTSFFALE